MVRGQKKSIEKRVREQSFLSFQKELARFKKAHGLRVLPWRATTDPYKIAVSELMLQQTQVDRVIPKYQAFIALFPNVQSLARAPVEKVLTAWSGLGYNRRARFVSLMAKAVVNHYKGVFPTSPLELISLPGIGPYTAGAICAFAYNQPSAFIEANIRTVFLHHFFSRATKKVSDTDLIPLIEQTLDRKNPRAWYNLLMDYGTWLKASGVVSHRKSAQYVKQKAFTGSLREVRGYLIKRLILESRSLPALVQEKTFSRPRLQAALLSLQKDGLIQKKGEIFSLAQT